MMQSKVKSIFKAGKLPFVIGLIIIGAVAGMMYLPSVHDSIYQQPKITTAWHLIDVLNPLAAEGNPGAGASGFIEIYFVNHTVTPNTAYAHNTSSDFETWANANVAASGYNAWANADNFLCQLKYGVLFDIVVRVRWNKTHAWDGAKFIGANVRVNITLTGFGTAGMTDIVGTGIVSYNNTGAWAIWENWYWQDADGGTGVGFSILKGSPWTANKITEIKIWAKY